MTVFASTNNRVLEMRDAAGRDRKRTKRCPDDRSELEERVGWLFCPSCGKTADEMEYEREPRLIASGAVAGMLREWIDEH
jgi:hypothetical protein